MCISQAAIRELQRLNMKVLMVESHLSNFGKLLGVQYPIVKAVQDDKHSGERKSDTNQRPD